jgi:hypothetical protein
MKVRKPDDVPVGSPHLKLNLHIDALSSYQPQRSDRRPASWRLAKRMGRLPFTATPLHRQQ